MIERPENALSTDVLSDVLRAVRLNGGVFFNVRAVRPWVAASRGSAGLAEMLGLGKQHVIPYHVVTEGDCWAGLRDSERVHLKTGDAIVFPQGDQHVLSDGPERRPEPGPDPYIELRNVELPVSVEVGGGAGMRAVAVARDGGSGTGGVHGLGRGPGAGGQPSARLVCGFLSCDVGPFNPLLDTLPRMLHQSYGAASDMPWLRHFLDVAVEESERKRAGGAAVLARLSELMFVEVVRRYVDSMPPDERGWLAGLREPAIARVLTVLHARPGHRWTLEELAAQVGLSRSVLAERFAQLTGMPVMQYLTRWRMQVAAGLLTRGSPKVAAVAEEVGYDSEAAFSRAFKKAMGTSPAAWRRERQA